MLAIWTYAVPIADAFAVEMPRGAVSLTVQMQRGVPTLWVRVDPKAPKMRQHFHILGTGHEHDDNDTLWRYIGTFQDGDLVWHLFQEVGL